MSFALADGLGFAAAALTTASFVPQAWLTFRTRDVSGISLGMYSAFTLGIALWLAYGLLMGAAPIVVANAITLALASAILVMKLRYSRSARKARDAVARPGPR
ncbi:MAG TPA: SemiSWEET transporter [Burkholderiaceae bacterium]|nr:SemiSWEET transporter [Burkholderiaceae bacterium]